MNKVIPLGLVGLGVYLLYNFSLDNAPRENAGGAANGSGNGPAAPAPSTAAAAGETLEQSVLRGFRLDNGAAATLPAALTFDQWNYYYQVATGRPGRAIEEAMPPGADRQALISFDAWRVSTAAGLGGFFHGA